MSTVLTLDVVHTGTDDDRKYCRVEVFTAPREHAGTKVCSMQVVCVYVDMLYRVASTIIKNIRTGLATLPPGIL